ncbi:hypothetical protein [Modestobacter sp. VKM Ac-2985]|uniref:hypothetical protein n=1 Tax=Modestobacter sp. VKM Ac-2985 TaxID=3004139 RepID=UPI0022ABBE02|nr:hypothetical protein [Modestobacter sp. VKM Ac-2985]MCZ2838573.1 hypothetical protein [Modestobacter sp. VKM Ac-2985]
MIRSVVRLLTVAALLATTLALPGSGSSPSATAQAADLSSFDPGNIISDAIFFDSLATDVNTVQTFLAAKGANCVAGEMPCLKDYRQSTANQTGDSYCATYQGAADETAAAILVKIGVACGINPRVLLVLLQKEQGLITGTRPSATRYTKATGFGCPDTAPCNPAFSGFVSQVYFAARQFQRYAAGAAGSYRAGRENKVHYHPDLTRCGSSQVFIQNKATAGLYSYTPYQPNAAALAAGYRVGDSCSSYGNRNFWNYFTDWFGSTQSRGATAIDRLHAATGGSTGLLGAPISGYLCGLVASGCWQQFQTGAIYYTPATGAHYVRGAIRIEWGDNGYEAGFLGYPVTSESCGLIRGGCWQQFQGGAVYWSPDSDVHFVRGAIRSAWAGQRWEAGVLGYPIADEACGLAGSGCWQQFQGGTYYYSPATGAHFVRGALETGWADQGRESGFLAYPLTDEGCGLVGGGCWQQFQGGSLYWSPASGVHHVRGAILSQYAAVGWENGALGYPTSGETCTTTPAMCTSTFQGGVIVWSPATGPVASAPPTLEGWQARGGATGPLGLPTVNTWCGLVGGGCNQVFTGGTLYSTARTGTHLVRGAILSRYAGVGREAGALGYPTSDESCTPANTCSNTFERGSIVWSPATGPLLVSDAVSGRWTDLGGVGGPLGRPLADTSCGLTAGGCSQAFEGGTMLTSPATGAFWTRGAIRGLWTSAGAQRGPLGYPLSDENCGLVGGGCFQMFQGGAVYWSPTSGVHAVSGGLWDAWAAQGWETGPWGYPTGDAQVTGSVVTQRYAGGTARWDTVTGTVTFG